MNYFGFEIIYFMGISAIILILGNSILEFLVSYEIKKSNYIKNMYMIGKEKINNRCSKYSIEFRFLKYVFISLMIILSLLIYASIKYKNRYVFSNKIIIASIVLLVIFETANFIIEFIILTIYSLVKYKGIKFWEIKNIFSYTNIIINGKLKKFKNLNKK